MVRADCASHLPPSLQIARSICACLTPHVGALACVRVGGLRVHPASGAGAAAKRGPRRGRPARGEPQPARPPAHQPALDDCPRRPRPDGDQEGPVSGLFFIIAFIIILFLLMSQATPLGVMKKRDVQAELG